VVAGPSGSLIPDAQVTAAEQGTGFSPSSRTLQDGSCDIPLLPPGRNHGQAAKGGFETLSQAPITLLANEPQTQLPHERGRTDNDGAQFCGKPACVIKSGTNQLWLCNFHGEARQ